MEDNQNKSEQTDQTQQSQLVTPPNPVSSETSWPSTPNKQTLAVLLVILFAASLATVGVSVYQWQHKKVVTLTKQVASYRPAISTVSNNGDQSQVSDEQLQKLDSAKDCTSLANVTITARLSKVIMKSINLDTGTLVTTKGGTQNWSYWGNELPIIYDSQCSKIKLSNIKAGDQLNVYYTADPQKQQILYMVQKL